MPYFLLSLERRNIERYLGIIYYAGKGLRIRKKHHLGIIIYFDGLVFKGTCKVLGHIGRLGMADIQRIYG